MNYLQNTLARLWTSHTKNFLNKIIIQDSCVRCGLKEAIIVKNSDWCLLKQVQRKEQSKNYLCLQ